MNKTIRLLASAGLLTLLAWRTDWRQVGEAFSRLRLDLWLCGVGLYCLTQVVSSVRWRILARPLGFSRPLGHYVSFYFIGMFFNLLLPTSVGGDAVRAWYLDGGSSRRWPAFLSVFVDRLSGLLILLVLACIGAALSPLALSSGLSVWVWITAGGALFFLGLFAVLVKCNLLGEQFHKLRVQFAQSAGLVFRPWPLFLSVVVQAANVILVWLIGVALGLNVPAAYYWILVPMVTLVTLLPISLNGMGLREWSTVAFLSPFGVSEGTSISLAFLWFATFTAASLVGVGFYLFGRFPRYGDQGPASEGVQGNDEPIGGDSDQGRTRQYQTAA